MNPKTATPLNILVTGWEGGGNVPPVIEATRVLVERGHRVRLIGDNSMAAEATRAGARHIPWLRAPNRSDRSPDTCFVRDWTIADPVGQFHAWMEKIFVGPAADHARDIVDALAKEPADLVVGSDLLFGSMLGAEKSNTPAITLATNVSIEALPGHPPFGPGFLPAKNEAEHNRDHEVAAMGEGMWNSFLPDLNASRTALGLAPLARTLDQLRYAKRHLLATSQAFDFPTTCLPANVGYVGPLLQEPDWAMPMAPLDIEGRSLVLVSFSTTFQGQDEALRTVIEAAKSLPVHAVVTLGTTMAGWRAGDYPNVTVLESASHDAILMRAAATVTHGGHGTTMRSLRHGVPLLVLPMGRDQNDNAARVEYRGAGLRLPPTANATEIAQALHRLMSEPHFAANAQKISKALAAEDSSDARLIAEIEAVASTTGPGSLHSCAA